MFDALARGLWELVDTAGSSHVLTVDMPSTDPQPSVRDAGIERDYAEHRAAVLGMLGPTSRVCETPRRSTRKAWAELLTIERRGEVVQHRRALLKKIAWRRAADATKRRRPDAIDPSSPTLIAATDGEALPDEQAQLRLDGDALRLVVESLDEQQTAALKLRFDQHLSAREVQDQLGIGEKRLDLRAVTDVVRGTPLSAGALARDLCDSGSAEAEALLRGAAPADELGQRQGDELVGQEDVHVEKRGDCKGGRRSVGGFRDRVHDRCAGHERARSAASRIVVPAGASQLLVFGPPIDARMLKRPAVAERYSSAS